MRRLVCYVLGEPGVGKTTLVRALLREWSGKGETPGPTHSLVSFVEKPKWTIAGDLVAAGHYKGEAFDGADTIPYNGARAALNYWADTLADSARLTILDGARFATKPSLTWLRDAGARVIGVHLVSPVGAAFRRVRRAAAARVPEQDGKWVRGAATSARNFAAAIGAEQIDATDGALLVAAAVNSFLVRELAQ